MQYSKNILDTARQTPLIKLNKVVAEISGVVFARVENFNLVNFAKDRMILKMVEEAESNGNLKPGGTIIDGTLQDIGFGLALAANVKGYQLICIISDTQPKEKTDILRAIGAKVIVCKTDAEATHPDSCFSISKKLSEEITDSWSVNPMDYLSNRTHYEQSDIEIWEQTKGKITHLVFDINAVEISSGVGQFLKEKNPNIKILGIEIESLKRNATQENEPYSLDGLIQVSEEDALLCSKELTLKEGIVAGKSSGAVLNGVLQLQQQFKPDDVIVVVFND